jgi:hypothetical protein
LTTFIDHRPPPGQGSVRTNDRSWVRSIHDGLLTCSSPPSHTRYCLLRNKGDSRPSIRQKGARRSSGQDRKDQVQMGGLSPHAPNTSRKIAVYRSLHHRGIPVARPLKTFC